MKITLTRLGNGIHQVMKITIENPTPQDLPFVENIIKNVEEYNQDQLDHA